MVPLSRQMNTQLFLCLIIHLTTALFVPEQLHKKFCKLHRSLRKVAAIGGCNYHLNDCGMVESDGGPCLIGKIINIKSSSKIRDLGACEVSLQLLGRVKAMVTVAKEDLYEVNFIYVCCAFT